MRFRAAVQCSLFIFLPGIIFFGATSAAKADLVLFPKTPNLPITVIQPRPFGAHPDGTLVISGGTVYLVQNAQLVGFRDPAEYASQGYNFSQVVPATDGDLKMPQGTVEKALPGTLALDSSDHKTVYMVGPDGTKRGFVSVAVFKALGYNFLNLAHIDLSDYPAGPQISDAVEAHPDGALVESGGTVWWIRGGKKQGFESPAVFASYGLNFSRVVKANAADLALP